MRSCFTDAAGNGYVPRQSSAAPCCSLPRGLLAEQNHMLQSVLPLNYDKRRPPTQPRLVPLPQGCTAAGTAGAAASRHHGATSDKLHRGGSRFQRCKCQAEAFAHRWNKHGRFPIKNITTELKSFKPTSPPASGQCSRRFGISHGASSKKGASAAEAAFSGETGSEAGFTIRPTKKTCPKKNRWVASAPRVLRFRLGRPSKMARPRLKPACRLNRETSELAPIGLQTKLARSSPSSAASAPSFRSPPGVIAKGAPKTEAGSSEASGKKGSWDPVRANGPFDSGLSSPARAHAWDERGSTRSATCNAGSRERALLANHLTRRPSQLPTQPTTSGSWGGHTTDPTNGHGHVARRASSLSGNLCSLSCLGMGWRN